MLNPKYLTLTMKMLLYYKSSKEANDLDQISVQYVKAYNYISQRYFENDSHTFTKNVHHNLYYSTRNLFDLKAQEAS